MDKLRGIMATTHIDRHNERVHKDELDNTAVQINRHESIQWITWNHQSTLPPIAFVDKAWVEQLEDGEFGLFFEATPLLEQENLVVTEELEITMDELDVIKLEIGGLRLSHDPRNFDEEDIQNVIEKLSSEFPIRHHYFVRKAELPQSVIWLVVAFVAGGVATGFLNRLGEVLADQVISVTRPKLKRLGEVLTSLNERTLAKDRPDYIFIIPIQDDSANVEGALESPDDQTLIEACEKLPELYLYAQKLISDNQKDYFSDLKFLYNPTTHRWEINFLMIRKTRQVVKGKRYYIPEHPLRQRYDEELMKIKELGNE